LVTSLFHSAEPRPKLFSSLRLGLLLLLAAAPAALGQTASQITPTSVRPAAVVTRGVVALPELSGPAAPQGAERLKVQLLDTVIEGGPDTKAGTGQLAAAQAAFRTSIAGKTVSVAEIFSAAQALEAAYGQAGFVLTRVVVPAQKLQTGGTLRLVVIDGFIERLETRDLPPAVKARIEAVLAPLVGQRAVTLAQIERALVLAGDTPGTRVKSTLAAGSAPGGSVLILQARHASVTGALSVDNSVGSALGGVSPALSLQLNSVLGLGEQIYGQAGGYPFSTGQQSYLTSTPVNRQLALGLILPLGIDGWSANIEANRTDSAPDPAASQQFYSQFERVSARLKYPLIRSRALTLSNETAFDIEEETLSLLKPLSAPISLDRLRVLRDTVEISATTPSGGLLSGRVIGSIGLDAFGARSRSDATPFLPLSRQGADSDFQKAELSLHYSQLLAEHLGIDLFARAQTSFGKPLPRAEQIGLVGPNALSGFDAGTFQGDSGLLGRIEISSPWTLDLTTGAASLVPYAFGDLGAVWLMEPTAVERRKTTAGSFGLGLRIGAAPNPVGAPDAGAPDGQSVLRINVLSGIIDQTSLSLEWGHQYRNDGTPAVDRFTISSSIQF
jgi:hemolysin activation/secretion protein